MKNFRDILAMIMAIFGLTLIAIAVLKVELSYIWVETYWTLIIIGTVIFALAFLIADDQLFKRIAKARRRK